MGKLVRLFKTGHNGHKNGAQLKPELPVCRGPLT